MISSSSKHKYLLETIPFLYINYIVINYIANKNSNYIAQLSNDQDSISIDFLSV